MEVLSVELEQLRSDGDERHLGLSEDHLELLVVVFERFSHDEAHGDSLHLQAGLCFLKLFHLLLHVSPFFKQLLLVLLVVLVTVGQLRVGAARFNCGIFETAPVAVPVGEAEVDDSIKAKLKVEVSVVDLQILHLCYSLRHFPGILLIKSCSQ